MTSCMTNVMMVIGVGPAGAYSSLERTLSTYSTARALAACTNCGPGSQDLG